MLVWQSTDGRPCLVMTEERALLVQWKKGGWPHRPHANTEPYEHHCSFCSTGKLGTCSVTHNVLLAALCLHTSPLFMIEVGSTLMQTGVRYSVLRLMQRHCAFMLQYSRSLLPSFCYDREVTDALRLKERLWLLRQVTGQYCGDDAWWPMDLLRAISWLVVALTWLALFDPEHEKKIPPFPDYDVSYLWYNRVPDWYRDDIDTGDGFTTTASESPYKAVLASHTYIDLKRRRSDDGATDMHIDIGDAGAPINQKEQGDPNPVPKKKFKAVPHEFI